MKLSQLQYYQVVCECGSITKASKILHITQPSISSAIKALEIEFNVILFHRFNKRLSLTDDGKALLEYTKKIFATVEQAEQGMRARCAHRKYIKIGIPTAIGSVMFPPILLAFRQKHPDIKIDIHEFYRRTEVNMLDAGGLDFSLTITDDINRANVHIENTWVVNFAFYTNSANPLAKRESILLSDLHGEPLILMNESSYQYHVLSELFFREEVVPTVVHHSNQLTTIQQFVASGLASSILLDGFLPCKKGIVKRPLATPLFVNIGMIWKKGQYFNPIVAELIDFIRDWPSAFQHL